jgi:hypothetical protein
VGQYGVGCWTIIRDAGGDGFATIRTAVSWLGSWCAVLQVASSDGASSCSRQRQGFGSGEDATCNAGEVRKQTSAALLAKMW